MKKTLFTICLVVAALSWSAFGQDEQQYAGWMKTIGGTMGPLKKAVDAKAGADAAEAAKKLESTFAEVESFWAKRKTEDAVKLSQEARSASKELASAAGSGGDMAAGFAKLGATCKGCHATHRDKAADGSFKIK